MNERDLWKKIDAGIINIRRPQHGEFVDDQKINSFRKKKQRGTFSDSNFPTKLDNRLRFYQTNAQRVRSNQTPLAPPVCSDGDRTFFPEGGGSNRNMEKKFTI